MNLKAQVTSLELSKRLKELGVKQKSQFVYARFWSARKDVPIEMQWNLVLDEPNAYDTTLTSEFYDIVQAYSVAELLEIEPALCYGLRKGEEGWGHLAINYKEHTTVLQGYWETCADAVAAMLIHLIEQNLLDPKKV